MDAKIYLECICNFSKYDETTLISNAGIIIVPIVYQIVMTEGNKKTIINEKAELTISPSVLYILFPELSFLNLAIMSLPNVFDDTNIYECKVDIIVAIIPRKNIPFTIGGNKTFPKAGNE